MAGHEIRWTVSKGLHRRIDHKAFDAAPIGQDLLGLQTVAQGLKQGRESGDRCRQKDHIGAVHCIRQLIGHAISKAQIEGLLAGG